MALKEWVGPATFASVIGGTWLLCSQIGDVKADVRGLQRDSINQGQTLAEIKTQITEVNKTLVELQIQVAGGRLPKRP